jgi:hypothetical protein
MVSEEHATVVRARIAGLKVRRPAGPLSLRTADYCTRSTRPQRVSLAAATSAACPAGVLVWVDAQALDAQVGAVASSNVLVLFSPCRYVPDMPDEPLRPADPDDLCQALAFALTHDGRRQFKANGEHTARITAEHLARHLAMAGFVVMRRPGRGDFAGIAGGAKEDR